MNYSFEPLAFYHFLLLLDWLQRTHVQQFWDKDIAWTLDLVQEKYASYVKGYKIVGDIEKPIFAFILYLNGKPIGYIQYYNVSDFPREGYEVQDMLPPGLKFAAIDFFIGEKEMTGKGIGSAALKQFLEDYVRPKFDGCLVDPDKKNLAAIRAYEKAGFVRYKELPDVVLMIL